MSYESEPKSEAEKQKGREVTLEELIEVTRRELDELRAKQSQSQRPCPCCGRCPVCGHVPTWSGWAYPWVWRDGQWVYDATGTGGTGGAVYYEPGAKVQS